MAFSDAPLWGANTVAGFHVFVLHGSILCAGRCSRELCGVGYQQELAYGACMACDARDRRQAPPQSMAEPRRLGLRGSILQAESRREICLCCQSLSAA